MSIFDCISDKCAFLGEWGSDADKVDMIGVEYKAEMVVILGCVKPHLVYLLWVFRVFWCTDKAAEIVVRSAHAFSLALWYCSHWDFRTLQSASRDVYVSSFWFCSLIQSLASWYHIAYYRSMILSVSSCVNVGLLTCVVMWLVSACIPSSIFV